MSQQPYPTGSPLPPNPPREYGVSPQPVRGDERTAAIVAHLSAIVAALVSAGSLSLIGPLIVWFMYKDRSPVVRRAAAGAFNFNLAWWILYWVGWLFFVTIVGAVVAIPLWAFIAVVGLWCHLRGAMRAGDGRDYRYPFQLKVLR